jgi:hypothetical protein
LASCCFSISSQQTLLCSLANTPGRQKPPLALSWLLLHSHWLGEISGGKVVLFGS